ncbi:aspartate-semialdehyde dehydrogenase [Alkalibaculum sp. M08DMB]|uniref:Aspartate-semialdehyde dehydrogenase n=1 Tax=Alkalibaculum sporogenes TaxID=2655001 RepID=A0A6A7K5N8_9FIRM|nr:aspartate-semialdehyde dehydrogenase [Alkalibaculum sporogenes]MPW24702.1 aspartate-semialdehyde dehydrogenase [Alkalibaculum sporogenes]
MKRYNVAVVGATGMVGRKMLEVLEERNFPVENLYPMASARSAGDKITFMGKEYTVEELNENSFDKDIDVALFSAGGSTSEKFSPIAARNGVIVIDNSSAFRMDKNVPLIVPEVNPDDVQWHKNIIANPNCSTIQAMVPLKVLHDAYKIKRIIYSTYQAVSGSGVRGSQDLEEGISGQENKFYPHPIAFNVLPHIDVFTENGYTKEEIKMIEETKKILHDDNLRITATTVRVPVYYGHSESVNIEFERDFNLEELIKLLEISPGIVVQNNVSQNNYPTAVGVAGKDEVYVGRIRRDESIENGINLWIVADNIRKGAATNTVQIAELLMNKKLIKGV